MGCLNAWFVYRDLVELLASCTAGWPVTCLAGWLVGGLVDCVSGDLEVLFW